MFSFFPKLQSLYKLQLTGLSSQLGWYVIQLGVTFISSLWLIRHLDDSHWGSISLLVSYHGMFSVFSGIWLKDWVIKAIVEGRKVEPILGSVAFMAVLLSVLGFVVCGLSFRIFSTIFILEKSHMGTSRQFVDNALSCGLLLF
jgi:O-antigen/teichoic acid export membrane protein